MYKEIYSMSEKSENKQMENRSMMALEQRMPVKYSGNNGAYSSAIMKIVTEVMDLATYSGAC